MIDFLDELGNFKQKNFYTSKCKFFLHFTTTDPLEEVGFLLEKRSAGMVVVGIGIHNFGFLDGPRKLPPIFKLKLPAF